MSGKPPFEKKRQRLILRTYVANAGKYETKPRLNHRPPRKKPMNDLERAWRLSGRDPKQFGRKK